MQEHMAVLKEPSRGVKSKGSKRSGPRKVIIGGKEFPVVRGGIQMDLDDATAISLADVPSGYLIEFSDNGAWIFVRAVQNISRKGAEVVLLLRSSSDYPILLDRTMFIGMAASLILQRQRTRKDIHYLTEHVSDNGSLVAATVPCQGRTVGEVVEAGMRIFSETLAGLESIEGGILRTILYMQKKGMLPGWKQAGGSRQISARRQRKLSMIAKGKFSLRQQN
jgi:hypothetical protein